MNSVKNANSQSHEWLGEINHLLPLGSNGEACHGQVCFLEGTERACQWGGQVRCGDRDLWPEVVPTGEMSLWSSFSAWGVLIHLWPEHHSRKDTGAEAELRLICGQTPLNTSVSINSEDRPETVSKHPSGGKTGTQAPGFSTVSSF